jgi:hypothetical protein
MNEPPRLIGPARCFELACAEANAAGPSARLGPGAGFRLWRGGSVRAHGVDERPGSGVTGVAAARSDEPSEARQIEAGHRVRVGLA